MTFVDTPLDPSYPRPSRLDQVKGFIGDLARPWAIICTSTAASVATVIALVKAGPDPAALAILMGAVFTGVVGLYTAKSWEQAQAAKQAANVEVAKAAGPVQS